MPDGRMRQLPAVPGTHGKRKTFVKKKDPDAFNPSNAIIRLQMP
jgi:hypothetical protein